MVNVYNSAAERSAAKSFLHDLTCIAGLRSSSQRTNGVPMMSSNMSNVAYDVCNEVLKRAFNDVDSSIKALSGVTALDSLTKQSRCNSISWSATDVARALVYLAECLDLYWDDLNASVYEVDTFKKTLLGAAVEKYQRFTSNLQAATQAVAQTATAPRAASARTPRGQGTSSQKPVGPQSANVRDLKGTPGTKLSANGSVVYRIIGDNSTSRNVPTVFVRPLSSSGAKGSTNKIFINSGNGYTDMACWFDDRRDADDFLAKVLGNFTLPANISNLRVVQSKADSNGYFIVGTELGECAIRARQLNEALKESIDDDYDTVPLEEDDEEENGWEKVGARMTNEEFNALMDSMLKY